MSQVQETRKPNRFRITSIIIAVAMVVGTLGFLITPFTVNVSATGTDHYWIGTTTNPFIDTNWLPTTVPSNGDNLYFSALSIGPCNFNMTGDYGSFNLLSNFTNTVTQSASFSVTSYSQTGGTFALSSTYILTDYGDFLKEGVGGTITSDTLNLVMASDGSLITTKEIGFNHLTINGNVIISGADNTNCFRKLTVAPSKTLTISSGFHLTAITWYTFSFSNSGVIAGDGALWISTYNIDRTLALGTITCDLLITSESAQSSNRTLTLNDDADLHKLTVQSNSSSAPYTITLDLSSSNYGLSATNISMGTRGVINGRGSTIICSGNWDSSVEASFIAGTSTVQFTGTGSVTGDRSALHTYKFYNVEAAYSGKTTSLMNNMHIGNDLTLHGGALDPIANMTVFYGGSHTYNLNGTGTILPTSWLNGLFPLQIDAAANVYATFGSTMTIPGLNLYTGLGAFKLNLTSALSITGDLLFTDAPGTAGIHLNTNGYSLSFQNLVMTPSTGTVLDLTDSVVTSNGTWDSSATGVQLIGTNSTVVMAGTLGLLKTSASQSFGRLTINGTVTPLTDITATQGIHIGTNGVYGAFYGRIAKHSGNPVIHDGLLNHKDPSVLYANGKYYLAYSHEIPGSWDVRMMYSTDFENWTDMGIAITQTEVWEGPYIGAPYLFYDEGTYYLFYQGHGATWKIGYATNTNIDNIAGWAKYASNPIIANGLTYDAHACYDAQVFKFGNVFYLYYISQDIIAAERKLCLATSTDMVTWTKHPSNPIFETDTTVYGLEAGDILEITSGHWIMFATEWDGLGRQVVRQLASTNLVTWYESNPPVLTYVDPWESGGAGPDSGVGSPAIIKGGDGILIMYQGHNATRWALGVAIGGYYNLTYTGDGSNFTNLGKLYASEIWVTNLTTSNTVTAGAFTGTIYLEGFSSLFSVSVSDPMNGNISSNKSTNIITNSLTLGTQPNGIWFNITSATGLTWSADLANPNASLTFTLSGLESGRMYRLYVDGVKDLLLTASGSGVISFTYSGPWSEHQFEIVATSVTGQVSSLVNLIFIMFAVGIVVGVIAGGTHSLRRKEMLTTEQMMKSLLCMVIYIIIGIAGIGILYSTVA